MTEQEQRIAIAEACGFEVLLEGISPTDKLAGRKPGIGDGDWHILPDYLHDLNAMHEAEKTLDESQRTKFYWELAKIVLGDNVPLNCAFLLVHATAAQRAKAFLCTLGKWPSSPLRESE